MGLLDDLHSQAGVIADELIGHSYRLDFSIESLREIDRFFAEAGKRHLLRRPLLNEETVGHWIFGLGAYLGEVFCRQLHGQWKVDDADPKAAANAAIVFPSGATVWPVQRVAKRYREGDEAGIYHYALSIRDNYAFQADGETTRNAESPH